MKNDQMKYTFCLLAFIFVCISCSKYPKDVMPEEKMVDVTTDIQLAQGLFDVKAGDMSSKEERDRVIAGVLKKYNITEAVLDSSMCWYSDNPELNLKVSDSVRSRIQRKANMLRQQLINEELLAGKVSSSTLLTNENTIYTLAIDSVMIQSSKKETIFQFDVLGVSSISPLQSDVAFQFADTTIYVTKKIVKNGHYKIKNPDFRNITKLKNIHGYLRLEPALRDQRILLYNLKVENKGGTKVAFFDARNN